jgi:hypothetical protein
MDQTKEIFKEKTMDFHLLKIKEKTMELWFQFLNIHNEF